MKDVDTAHPEQLLNAQELRTIVFFIYYRYLYNRNIPEHYTVIFLILNYIYPTIRQQGKKI